MPSPRVVFDCNIFVQTLINLSGPAARCVQRAKDGEVLLFVSPYGLGEIREIHSKLPAKYGVTSDQCEELAYAIISFSTLVLDPPQIYQHPYDPDDSDYVNLAIHAQANLIVSRDRHLLMLSDLVRKEGREFHSRFPAIRALDPVELLRELDRADA